ncbi:MAG: glycine reductase [Parvibaculaceae bacterium]
MQDFAPADDVPVPYMARTRAYYQALGYGAPYLWAHYSEAPFAPLKKPLGECCVALVTTAAPHRPELGDQGPGAPYNAAAKFFRVYSQSIEGRPDVRISHIAYDRRHTSAEDPATWFPLAALKQAAEAGRIGGLTPRFHGLPTNRSHRVSLDEDCPALLDALRADKADAAVLVPNCPVCHQSVALAARHIEAAGLPTVVMGCAKDIVEHVGAPRFLFSDFPLGNGAGRPHDPASQETTLELALRLLESAPGPRITFQSPLRWSEDPDWKLDYCNAERLAPEELARLKSKFDADKAVARELKAG